MDLKNYLNVVTLPMVTLINGFVPFVFVIPPTDIKVKSEFSHKMVSILDYGEITNGGDRQCVRLSWSGFFPKEGSYHYNAMLNALPPIACIEYLRYCLNNKTVFRMVIPKYAEFLKCKIESFEVYYPDHTGDAYYKITVIEEREGISSLTTLIEKGVVKLKERF